MKVIMSDTPTPDAANTPTTQPLAATLPPETTPASTANGQSLADPPKMLHPLLATEVVFGMLAIVFWLCFFTAGAFVGTEPYRKALMTPGAATMAVHLKAWFIVLTCYTFTNTAILSCAAGVIGKFCRRSLAYEVATLHHYPRASEPTIREVLVMYSVAIARGWVIYLMLAAGLLILTSDKMANPEQGDYIRLAGTVSVIGFLAGYDADVFKRALDRVAMFSMDAPRKG